MQIGKVTKRACALVARWLHRSGRCLWFHARLCLEVMPGHQQSEATVATSSEQPLAAMKRQEGTQKVRNTLKQGLSTKNLVSLGLWKFVGATVTAS